MSSRSAGPEPRSVAPEPRPVAALSSLAASQHGVVSLAQARAVGLSRDAVRRHSQRGWLHPVHRGVYAVGHGALTTRGRQMAAVLAAGPDAVLSHRSAGLLHDLLHWSGATEVTASRSRTKHGDIRVHRSRCLGEADRENLDGVPVTSVARTLVDLAEVLNDRRLAAAVHEAEIRKLFDLGAVEQALARVPGRVGQHRLRRVLAAYGGGPPLTRSEAERRFLDICHRYGLATPRSAVTVGGYELDFLWAAHGLGVEVDGAATHYTIHAFYEDRRRDRALVPHGVQVIRVTWRDLEDERTLAAELRDILASKRLGSA